MTIEESSFSSHSDPPIFTQARGDDSGRPDECQDQGVHAARGDVDHNEREEDRGTPRVSSMKHRTISYHTFFVKEVILTMVSVARPCAEHDHQPEVDHDGSIVRLL